MKRSHAAWAFVAAAIVWSTVRAQTPDFMRPPPSWQTALAASTEATAGRGIAAQGKGADAACASCHGASGVPAAGIPFPYLAGMSAEYLTKQLLDYREGTRPNAVMGSIAKALTDADIGSLARHYASLKAPVLEVAPPSTSTRGRKLQEVGDNALAIPACANSHGRTGRGGARCCQRSRRSLRRTRLVNSTRFAPASVGTTATVSCAPWPGACRTTISRR